MASVKKGSRGSKGNSGQIRIIGGRWRSRKLPVHDAEGLRPTTDRVKETVFNWLAPFVDGAHCLDLFAGSGGLSFEALSRFADSALLLEKDRTAARQLTQNLITLNCDNGIVKNTDSLTFLASPASQQFNLVFIDPPFRKELLEKSCQLLEQNGWLSAEAVIYLEMESELAQVNLPTNWHCLKEKSAGQVTFSLWQRQS
jgi:16S rRNA (guanine966-N2)-methyltransferase